MAREDDATVVRAQIQVTQEQMEALRHLATRQEVSFAELVRRAIDALLRTQHVASTDDRRRRALEVAGQFASGHRNVSARHDEHLAAAFGR